MPSAISVAVVGGDRHLVLGLAALGLTVAHHVQDPRDLPASDPSNVVLVVAAGSSALEACRRVQIRWPGARVVVADPDGAELFPELLRRGVVGLVVSEDVEHIQLAVWCAARDASLIPAGAARALAETVLKGWTAHHNRYGLTGTELTVWRLAGGGLTNREIADRLGRMVATVRTHLQHLHAKLGTRSRAELVERWREWPQSDAASDSPDDSSSALGRSRPRH